MKMQSHCKKFILFALVILALLNIVVGANTHSEEQFENGVESLDLFEDGEYASLAEVDAEEDESGFEEDLEQQLEFDVASYDPQDNYGLAWSFVESTTSKAEPAVTTPYVDGFTRAFGFTKVQSYFHSGKNNHYYCSKCDAKQTTNYTSTNVAFVCPSATTPSTMSRLLVSYAHKKNTTEYFLPTTTLEPKKRSAYTPVSPICRIYTKEYEGTVPLTRCYNKDVDDYSLTTGSCVNKPGVAGNYTSDRVLGYVYPSTAAMSTQPTSFAVERMAFLQPADKVRVAWNTKSSTTFQLLAGNATLPANHTQADAFVGVKATAPNAVPLFTMNVEVPVSKVVTKQPNVQRFSEDKTTVTFITRDDKTKEGFTSTKTVTNTKIYVSSIRTLGMVPLYRCVSQTDAPAYTIAMDCAKPVIPGTFAFDSVLGYVYPATFTPTALETKHFKKVDVKPLLLAAKKRHMCRTKAFATLLTSNVNECIGELAPTKTSFSAPSCRMANTTYIKRYNKGFQWRFDTVAEEAGFKKQGFVMDTKDGFCMYNKYYNNTVPVYACKHTEKPEDKIYSLQVNCENIAGYTYDKVIGWVYPGNMKALAATAVPAEDTKVIEAPVKIGEAIHMWNNTKTDYITHLGVVNRPGFVYSDKLAMFAVKSNTTVPLYRFVREKTKFFLSRDKNAEGLPELVADGVVGYVYANKTTATIPFYRCYNEELDRYSFTIDRDCNGVQNYQLDALLGYVYPKNLPILKKNNELGLNATNNAYPPAIGGRIQSYNPSRREPIKILNKLLNNTKHDHRTNPKIDESGFAVLLKETELDLVNVFTYRNGTVIGAFRNNATIVVDAMKPNPAHPQGCYNDAMVFDNVCFCGPKFTGKWCHNLSREYRKRLPIDLMRKHFVQNVNNLEAQLRNYVQANNPAQIKKIIDSEAKREIDHMLIARTTQVFREALSRNDIYLAKEQLSLMQQLDNAKYQVLTRELALHEDKMVGEAPKTIRKMTVAPTNNLKYDFIKTDKVVVVPQYSLADAEELVKKADLKRREFNLAIGDSV